MKRGLLALGLALILIGVPLAEKVHLGECVSIQLHTDQTILNDEGWNIWECVKAFS
jgi:hypothetical protein